MGLFDRLKVVFTGKTSINNKDVVELSEIVDDNKDKKVLGEFIIKDYNCYTNITLYYKCIIKKLGSNDLYVTSERLPEGQYEGALTFEEADSKYAFGRMIRDSVGRTADIYFNEIRYDNPLFFDMTQLYKLKNKESDTYVYNAYNGLLKLKEVLENKCNEFGISCENDVDKIFSRILREINDYTSVIEKKLKIAPKDMDFCMDRKTIDESVNDEKIKKTFNSWKFYGARMDLTSYYSSFITYLPICLMLLDKKELTADERVTLSKYLELFRVIDRFMDIVNYLEEAYSAVEKGKLEARMDKYNKNHAFINQIEQLIVDSKCSEDELYIHATTSLNAANNILKKGLYLMGNEKETFCFPFESVNQILEYNYGSASRQVGNYIILIRLPADDSAITEIFPDEAKIAMGEMDMRRVALLAPPSHKVLPEYIVGLIDKNKMQVIYNPNYSLGETKKFSH